MTKRTKDAENGNVLVGETDVKSVLVEAKEYGKDARDKKGLEEMFEVCCITDGGVGEKA